MLEIVCVDLAAVNHVVGLDIVGEFEDLKSDAFFGKGHDKGCDYRLCAKTNSIGRGEDMDVRIKGDDTISSNIHAKIDYDVLNNAFYLLPANNRNTIYVNNAPLYAAQRLNPYDRLRFGQSELLFVPFCCDRFTWPIEGER